MVVTREQALGHGLSPHVVARLLREDTWQPLARAIYLLSGGQPCWESLAWGGILAGGDDARLGAESSAYLHKITRDPPAEIDILVPNRAPARVMGPWRFIRESPGARPGGSIGSPPCLTVATTLLELGISRTPADLLTLIAEAEHRRLISTPELVRTLRQYRRYPYRRVVMDLLGDIMAGVQSPIERLYLHDVERAHQLPVGSRQEGNRGLAHRSDVAYDEYRLLVELDGWKTHGGAGRFRDLWLDNQFALRGQVTLRFGHYDLTHRPCSVAFQVHRVMSSRGCAPPFTRCQHCVLASDQDLLLT